MRIGIICPYSLSVPGGVQGQVLGLARALRQLGHDARVLGPCDGPPPEAGVTPLGDSLPLAVNGSMAPIAPDVSAQLRTIRALRDERFDVVHVHEPLVPGVCQTALLFKSQPVVGTFHAAGQNSAPYRWLNPAARWLARKIDVRSAVSADARDLAHRAVSGHYEVVFNGVELEPYVKGAARRTDHPTIFFIGRHEPRKGLAVLLEAMGELPPSVRLWVGSDGPETSALHQQVAGDVRIQWLGRLSEREKIERLKGADVFCAPSLRGESFGVVLLEAMAASTAIVATELPGYAHVAVADRDALLVPPGDPVALAAALRRVLTDHDLANRLVAAGEQRAAEFSMERLAQVYLPIYERARAGR